VPSPRVEVGVMPSYMTFSYHHPLTDAQQYFNDYIGNSVCDAYDQYDKNTIDIRTMPPLANAKK
jgi:hypothetical protein